MSNELKNPRNKFRLLRVISSVNPLGGGPIEGIKQLYLPMKEYDIELEVVCCDEPGALWLASCELPLVHALGRSYTSYCYSPNLLKWLRKNMARFDAVIVHGLWQYHGYAVRRALIGTTVPYYVFTHGMLDPWFKSVYPLKHLKKWLYWFWFEYQVLRDAKAVLFTSEEERLQAKKSFWLYRCSEKVTAYGTSMPPPDSINLKECFFLQYPQLRAKRLLLFLGRIHEKKGCDLLISAFAQVADADPDLHLVMAGPDQTGWVDELKRRALKLGIASRITWTGMLYGDNKWGAYYAAEVFCLPSHQENFGIAVAEALACGIPVLISNKVNIWREIDSHGAGIIGEDSIEGTSKTLSQWLSLTNEKKQQMKDAALQCFAARFRIDKVAESLVNIVANHATLNSSDEHRVT